MKKTKRIFKVIFAFMAIIIIIASALILRLSMGPMSIAFLDNAISNPLQNAFPTINVSFEEPSLYWNRQEDSLDLQLSKVVFSRANGEVIAQSPFVGLAVSKTALLEAKIEPTRLDLIGPSLELQWRAQSLVEMLSNDDAIIRGPAQMMQAQEQPPILTLVQALMGTGEIEGPLSQLVSVNIMDGDIWLEEIETGQRWHLPNTLMQFSKGAGGLNLAVDMTLQALGDEIALQVRTLSHNDEGDFIRFEFGEMNLAKLARAVNLGEAFEVLDIPISGMTTLAFDKVGLPLEATFNIGGGQGQINLPQLYAVAPQIDQVELSGAYSHNDKTLRIDTMNLNLGMAEVSIDGIVNFAENAAKPDLTLYINAVNMPLREVLTYWPERFARGGHNWVNQHTEEGMIDEVNLALAIKTNYWGMKPMPEDAVHIDFKFSNLTAHYLRPMPPLTNAVGVGVATPNNIAIDIFSGQTDGISLNPSKFRGENLGYPELRRGFTTFSVTTPVAQLLKFIDQDPINRNRSYTINPDEFGGLSTSVGRFDFPLQKGNTIDDVNMLVNVTTQDGAIPNLMPGGGVTNANLDIEVTKEGISASGPIEVKDVPMQLNWSEQFKMPEGQETRSRYEVTADMTAEHLVRFGVPALGRMQGSALVNMVIHGNGKELVEGQGTVNLQNTIVHSPKLAWWKGTDTQGQADFTIKWTGDTFWLDDLRVDSHMDVTGDDGVEAGRFTSQATMHFDKVSGRLLEAYIPSLKSAGHDLSMVVNLSIDDYIELMVDAREIDLSSFLEDLIVRPKGTDYIPEALIIINAKRATALNGVGLENFKLDTWNMGGYWASSDMRGQFSDGAGSFSLLLNGTYEGRNIEIKSDNAGQLALAAGLFLNGQGGKLNLTAELGGADNADDIEGSMSIEDFRIVKSAPFISALEASHGFELDSLIDENGMKFSELYVPFTVDEGIIDINNAKANGPAMGFTMEGQVNQRSKQLHLNGLIVPAFSLNSILGKIPLIGALLGGSDGGLFALAYRIEGDTKDPDFSFNPLSAIAPGFLRKIFEGQKGTVDINQDSDVESPNSPTEPEGENTTDEQLENNGGFFFLNQSS